MSEPAFDEHKALRAAADELEGILSLSFPRLWLLVASAPAFHVEPWGELLLQRSLAAGARDPRRAAELALAAVVGLELGSATVSLRCKAWVEAGTALRTLGEYSAARRLLDRARELARQGDLPPAELVPVVGALRSLEYELGRFDAAVALGEEAVELCRSTGDRHREGFALAQLGLAYAGLDRIEDALAATRRGFAMVKRSRNPTAWARACQNLAVVLVKVNRCHEALRLLDRAHDVLLEIGDEVSVLKVRWIQGRAALRIAPSLGSKILKSVAGAYIERDLSSEACLVALDIAEDHVARGETAEARAIVHQITPVFASLGLSSDAIAAWMMLADAVAGGIAVEAALAQVRRILSVLDQRQVVLWKGRQSGRPTARPARGFV